MLKIFLPVDWKLVDLEKETDPNLIGEALRHWSFVGRNGEIGCYSTFQVADFFKPLKPGDKDFEDAKNEIVPEFDTSLKCYVYKCPYFKDEFITIEPLKIVLAWEWNGDGTLYFKIVTNIFEKNFTIMNTDCKKDYGWEFVK